MRLERRHITRGEILDAVDSYEIVESYPEDKYLPSYLIVAADSFHVLFAVDVVDDNIRVVTAYRPDPEEWRRAFDKGGNADEMPSLRRKPSSGPNGPAVQSLRADDCHRETTSRFSVRAM
jgi:hypothetical protein